MQRDRKRTGKVRFFLIGFPAVSENSKSRSGMVWKIDKLVLTYISQYDIMNI